MGNNNKEVKELFVENEEGEEIVDPSLLEEETETPSESSPEEEPEEEAEEPEPEEAEEEPAPQPKPVEGETPRERALRLEVERLRKVNRGEKGKELLGKEEPHKNVLDDDILSQYEPEELKNFDRLFDAMAKSKGLVKKDDLNSSASDDVLDGFLAKHTEYSPENDPDNALWDSFKKEYSLFKKPDNPKDLQKILDRVHATIFPSKTINTNAVAAQQAKIKTAAHGGTTVVRASSKVAQIDPSLKAHLKGFTDEELSEM